MEKNTSNKCGHCNNFSLNDDDFQLIPLGNCDISNSIDSDFHRAECGHFVLKPELKRNINCNGCHYELWPEHECTCIRNRTSEEDKYYIAVKY
jgi:hypothetical protein